MQQEIAETRALTLLAWLAAEDELMPVFMGATGASEGDMRARAGEPEFLASVLDFLLMDDQWVIKAAQGTDIPAENFSVIRSGLPGGGAPDWT